MLYEVITLAESYQQAGFSYRQDLFALRCNGRLIAIFAAMHTAVGLNLSNLTNAITALIVITSYSIHYTKLYDSGSTH